MKLLLSSLSSFALCLALIPAFAEENTTTPDRGKIVDRHGVVLADNDATVDGKRVYPFGAAAAHTLLSFSNAFQNPSDFEAQLSQGEDLQLTLDIRVQLAAELAMRRIGKGAAVVTDPDTGEILAMVSVPSFDPAIFSPRISRENFDRVQNDAALPLLNRTIAGEYPPGSIFKAVTALAAPAGKQSRHTCKNHIEINGRLFRCWQRNGHGELDLRGALNHSCNVYFYELGKEVGIGEISRNAKLVGFGAKTGIPFPGERRGLIPDEASHKKKFGTDWTDGDTANATIGQGLVTATVLQSVGAIGAVANDGLYIQPMLVENGKPKRVDLTQHGIAAETIETIRLGMWDAVNSRDGTGRRARLEGKRVYGKTGTAQWGKPGRFLAWFSGWVGDKDAAAKEKPRRYAITVLVENGEAGGRVAAPLARMILADCLALPPKPASGKVAAKRLEPANGHDKTIKNISDDE